MTTARQVKIFKIAAALELGKGAALFEADAYEKVKQYILSTSRNSIILNPPVYFNFLDATRINSVVMQIAIADRALPFQQLVNGYRALARLKFTEEKIFQFLLNTDEKTIASLPPRASQMDFALASFNRFMLSEHFNEDILFGFANEAEFNFIFITWSDSNAMHKIHKRNVTYAQLQATNPKLADNQTFIDYELFSDACKLDLKISSRFHRLSNAYFNDTNPVPINGKIHKEVEADKTYYWKMVGELDELGIINSPDAPEWLRYSSVSRLFPHPDIFQIATDQVMYAQKLNLTVPPFSYESPLQAITVPQSETTELRLSTLLYNKIRTYTKEGVISIGDLSFLEAESRAYSLLHRFEEGEVMQDMSYELLKSKKYKFLLLIQCLKDHGMIITTPVNARDLQKKINEYEETTIQIPDFFKMAREELKPKYPSLPTTDSSTTALMNMLSRTNAPRTAPVPALPTPRVTTTSDTFALEAAASVLLIFCLLLYAAKKLNWGPRIFNAARRQFGDEPALEQGRPARRARKYS